MWWLEGEKVDNLEGRVYISPKSVLAKNSLVAQNLESRMSLRLIYPIAQEMANNNNNHHHLTPSAQPSPPLTPFSAIAPPPFGRISRPQIQITLHTIYEDETEAKIWRRHCYHRKQASSSSFSSALSCFRPLRSLKCSWFKLLIIPISLFLCL